MWRLVLVPAGTSNILVVVTRKNHIVKRQVGLHIRGKLAVSTTIYIRQLISFAKPAMLILNFYLKFCFILLGNMNSDFRIVHSHASIRVIGYWEDVAIRTTHMEPRSMVHKIKYYQWDV